MSVTSFLVRVSLIPKKKKLNSQKYVEIKCHLDATEVFIAYLIACSTCFGHHYAHHQELKSIIQWLLPVVSPAVVFKLLFGLQDANRTHNPQLHTRTT